MNRDLITFDFGYRLHKLRVKAQLTQEQLASKAGISRSSLYRYENSHNIPDGIIIKKLALALQTSADYLLGISNTSAIILRNLTDKQERLVYDFISEFVGNK